MAVFGDKHGQGYKMEANVVGDVGVECSASVKVTVEDEVRVKEVGGAATSSSSPSSSSSAPSRAESAKESVAVAEDVVPEPVVESLQRGLTTPPGESADDFPLCSGALPVESDADAPDGMKASSHIAEGNHKGDDAVAVKEKKPRVI